MSGTTWKTSLHVGAPNDTHRIDGRYVMSVGEWAKAVRLQGYTLYRTMGYWEGQKEESLVIEVMGRRITDRMVQVLREKLKQQAILVDTHRVQSHLVDASKPTLLPHLLLRAGGERYRLKVMQKVEVRQRQYERLMKLQARLFHDFTAMFGNFFGAKHERGKIRYVFTSKDPWEFVFTIHPNDYSREGP